MPEPSEGPSSYLRIADVIRQRIIEGRYAPGSILPTQDSLRREFTVSRDTLQSALKILRNDGLLENGGRGRAARVAERQVSTTFEEHIGQAFAAEHVTLDIFSLTAQTVSQAVVAPLEAIRQGELTPRSVAVRLLLPSPDGHYEVPVAIDDPSDERPLRRLLDLVRSYAVVLENQFQTLAETGRVPSVSVEIRVVRLEPSFKLCIANGNEALFALYLLGRNDIPYGRAEVPERISIYDFQGTDKDVFTCGRGDAGGREGVMFDQLSRWFDTRWNTIARPFPRNY